MRFIAQKLSEWELIPKQREILKEFKARCVSASLKALLHYVYSRYPEMTSKSNRREVLDL